MQMQFKNYTLEIKDTELAWHRTCILKQDNNIIVSLKEEKDWRCTIEEMIYYIRQMYLRNMKQHGNQADLELNNYLRGLEKTVNL